MNVKQLFFLTFLIINVQCSPQVEEEKQLGRPSLVNNLGSFGSTESQATAHGLDSTVEISGIVSGDTSSTSGLTSTTTSLNNQNLVTVSQVNCSEVSSTAAHGSTGTEVTATGDCLLNLGNTDEPQKVVFGMEGQASTPPNQQNGPQGSSINQVTFQNSQEGYAEGYQSVSGSQPTSSFSGVMAPAQAAQGPQSAAGTSETTMFHSMGTTNVETVFTPFIMNRPTSRIGDWEIDY